jgi:hypothetical protein
LVKGVKILNLAKWGSITALWNLNVSVSYYKSAIILEIQGKNRGGHLNN